MSACPNFKLTPKEKRMHAGLPTSARKEPQQSRDPLTRPFGAQACRQPPTPICRNGSLKLMQVHTNRAS